LVERHLLGRLQERPALDELHGDVRFARHLADLEHLADVRVVDARLCARLLQEALRRVRVGVVEELDRRRTIDPLVARPIDDAHPALAEQLDQLVAIPLLDGRRASEPDLALAPGVPVLDRVVEGRRAIIGATRGGGVAHRGCSGPSAARSTMGGRVASWSGTITTVSASKPRFSKRSAVRRAERGSTRGSEALPPPRPFSTPSPSP